MNYKVTTDKNIFKSLKSIYIEFEPFIAVHAYSTTIKKKKNFAKQICIKIYISIEVFGSRFAILLRAYIFLS